MKFLIYDTATGKILSEGDVPESMIDIQVVEPGSALFVPSCDYSAQTHTHIKDGLLFGDGTILRERKLMDIRIRRNALLDQADLKYCNPDNWENMTPQQKKVWRDYKKELKDFPASCDPDNPVWPELPK